MIKIIVSWEYNLYNLNNFPFIFRFYIIFNLDHNNSIHIKITDISLARESVTLFESWKLFESESLFGSLSFQNEICTYLVDTT